MLEKILELDQQIRNKQVSRFSAHTLMPVGLVITIIGFSFAIGMSFQSTNQTKLDLESFKADYKESQEAFKKEYKENQIDLKADIKSISAQVQDIRVLILSNPNITKNN